MAHCDEYAELISAALDGALSPDDRARLDAHLKECPRCRALMEDLRALRAGLLDLPSPEPPAGLTDRIMAAVAADKATPLAPPKKRPAQPWRRWAAAAAVAAVVLAGRAGFTGRHPALGTTAVQNTPSTQAMDRDAPVPGTPAAGESSPAPAEAPASKYAALSTPAPGQAAAGGHDMAQTLPKNGTDLSQTDREIDAESSREVDAESSREADAAPKQAAQADLFRTEAEGGEEAAAESAGEDVMTFTMTRSMPAPDEPTALQAESSEAGEPPQAAESPDAGELPRTAESPAPESGGSGAVESPALFIAGTVPTLGSAPSQGEESDPLPAEAALKPQEAMDRTVDYIFAFSAPESLEREYREEENVLSCTVRWTEGGDALSLSLFYFGEHELHPEAYVFICLQEGCPPAAYLVDKTDLSVSVTCPD